MNKYLKFTVIGLIVFLSGFIIATSNNQISTIEDETNKLPIEEKDENFSVGIQYYPEEKTKKVNHKLDSLFKRIHKRHDFHGSVLVAQQGKVIFKGNYGYANFSKKTKIDSSSIFQLASVSKQFTAGAIMILRDRELLKLSDTITQFFPDFPYKEVTVKHLLNHTAGLPNYFWIAEHKWKNDIAPTNSEMLELMNTSGVNRFFRPGRKFDYSNSAYFVLASIIEKVSKQSYATFLRDNIFNPLDMQNSYAYSFEHDPVHTNQLDGYRLYRGWRHAKIRGTVNDGVVGDKNIYSTTEDLYKWITGLNSGKLISEESLNLMYSNGETRYGRKIPYGFGFRLDFKNNQERIYHYGRWNGFSTALTQYTDEDIVVIALVHSSFRSMTYLNKSVKKIVLNNFKPDIDDMIYADSGTSNAN